MIHPITICKEIDFSPIRTAESYSELSQRISDVTKQMLARNHGSYLKELTAFDKELKACKLDLSQVECLLREGGATPDMQHLGRAMIVDARVSSILPKEIDMQPGELGNWKYVLGSVETTPDFSPEPFSPLDMKVFEDCAKSFEPSVQELISLMKSEEREKGSLENLSKGVTEKLSEMRDRMYKMQEALVQQRRPMKEEERSCLDAIINSFNTHLELLSSSFLELVSPFDKGATSIWGIFDEVEKLDNGITVLIDISDTLKAT